MAERVAGIASSSSVLVTNNCESREIACIYCAERELELVKTQIELRSTQKIVELLREEIELSIHNLSSQLDVNYQLQNEYCSQLKDNGKWSVIRSKRQKTIRNPQQCKNSNLIQLVSATQNRFEALANLKGDSNCVLSKVDKTQILNSCSNEKDSNQLARSDKKK
jgi:hypothetical protein